MIYQKGYKYQNNKDETLQTNIIGFNTETDYIKLDMYGLLTVYKGYAWDGCSGPTIDCEKSMTPSLIHDALYQLMQDGVLPSSYKEDADKIFYDLLMERNFGVIRANVYYWAVSKYGKTEKRPRIIYEAP